MKLSDRFREKFAPHGLKAESVGFATSRLEDLGVKEEGSTGRLLITATATTSAVDLDGEVVVPSGCVIDGQGQPSPLMTLKAVYYNHDYWTLPVATVRNVKMRKDGTGWTIQALTASNEFARDVAVTVQDGAINAGSIGFARLDWGNPTPAELDKYGLAGIVTRAWEWWEWSITPCPANPEAMIEGVEPKSLTDDTIRAIEGLASKGRIAVKSARAMGVPERKLHPVPRIIPRLIEIPA